MDQTNFKLLAEVSATEFSANDLHRIVVQQVNDALAEQGSEFRVTLDDFQIVAEKRDGKKLNAKVLVSVAVLGIATGFSQEAGKDAYRRLEAAIATAFDGIGDQDEIDSCKIVDTVSTTNPAPPANPTEEGGAP